MTEASESKGSPPQETAEELVEHGEIKIHHQVIATIARLAALKVPGVAGLASSFSQGLFRAFGKPTENPGIRVVLEEDGVIIDVYLVVQMGVRIPQVAWRVQSDVRQAVEQMTGKNVKAVNVVVQGLRGEAEGEKPL